MENETSPVTDNDLHKLGELRELLGKFELEKYEETLTGLGIDTISRLGRVPDDILLEFFKSAKVPPMHQRDFRSLCNFIKNPKQEVIETTITETENLQSTPLFPLVQQLHLPVPTPIQDREQSYSVSKHYWEQRSDDILYQLAEKLEKWDKEGICIDKLEPKEFALIIRDTKACVKCSCGHLSPIFVRRDRKRGPISFQRLRDHLRKHKGVSGISNLIHTPALTTDLTQIPSLPPFQLGGMEQLYKDEQPK
jgi:hypothetical protein